MFGRSAEEAVSGLLGIAVSGEGTSRTPRRFMCRNVVVLKNMADVGGIPCPVAIDGSR
jgi:hypothetical protein